MTVETITMSAALVSRPSLTTSRTVYAPARSGVSCGVAVVPPTRAATLPEGCDTRAHWKVRGSPSGSLDRVPSSGTVVPTGAVTSGPAFATGGWFTGAHRSGLSTMPSQSSSVPFPQISGP